MKHAKTIPRGFSVFQCAKRIDQRPAPRSRDLAAALLGLAVAISAGVSHAATRGIRIDQPGVECDVAYWGVTAADSNGAYDGNANGSQNAATFFNPGTIVTPPAIYCVPGGSLNSIWNSVSVNNPPSLEATQDPPNPASMPDPNTGLPTNAALTAVNAVMYEWINPNDTSNGSVPDAEVIVWGLPSGPTLPTGGVEIEFDNWCGTNDYSGGNGTSAPPTAVPSLTWSGFTYSFTGTCANFNGYDLLLNSQGAAGQLIGYVDLNGVSYFTPAVPGWEVTATHNFNLTGNTASLSENLRTAGNPFVQYYFPLINTANGLSQIPAFTLSVGDTLQGTVSLNNAVTVPASTAPNALADLSVGIPLSKLSTDVNIAMTESVTYLYNGLPVTLPAGFKTLPGSNGALILGGGNAVVATAGFTFNQVQFQATVTSILNASNQHISSVAIPTGTPSLQYTSYLPPSSILWHNTNGSVNEWFMNGGTIASSVNVTTVPSSWTIAGRGDFNGDGTPDILWRNTSGDVVIWFMNAGGTIASSTDFGVVPNTWSIAGTGDFNDDGKSDILWHNSSGDVVIWLMNGGAIASSSNLGDVPATWSIVGTGDFNDDLTTDILWRNSASGDVVIWFMNKGAIASSSDLGTVPSTWSVVGTGDFKNNQHSDILWRNSNGDVVIWFMNGGTITSSTNLGVIPTSWTVAGTADYNFDGNADILWRNSNGDVEIWFMNGGTIASSANLGIIALSWSIAP